MKGFFTPIVGAVGSTFTLAHFNDFFGAIAGVFTAAYMGLKLYAKLQKIRRKKQQPELFDTDL